MASALTRRSLLTVSAAVGATPALAACGGADEAPRAAPSDVPGVARHYYGSDRDSQFGDLYLPRTDPIGTAVLIHGGFWLDQYGSDLMDPMAKVLLADGWVVWNLEYRRLGNGGGWPTTFEDTATGIDHLARLDGVDLSKVVLLGHSAGGHLAVWAASRTADTPGGAPLVKVRGVVSLAGVLDLADGEERGLGGGVIDQLVGGAPDQFPQRYRIADPAELVPANSPVAVVRGRNDTTVPRRQATEYVAAAEAAKGEVALTELSGDHFTIIDPTAPSWPAISRLLRNP